MVNVSVTYPALSGAVVAGVREVLGDDAEGLTDDAAVKKALRRTLKGWAKSYRRRTASNNVAAVAAADTAIATEELAKRAAVQARKDAEDTEDGVVEAAFGADS